MLVFAEFLLLGLGIGCLGALVGAGGGFILTPLLLLLFPDRPPEIITATSLTVVALNALSAFLAYYRLGRADMKTGFLYGLVASPWVVVGVFGTTRTARGPFDLLLGILLLGLCLSLLTSSSGEAKPTPSRGGLLALSERRIVDRAGTVFAYRFRFRLGFLTSMLIGFMASFFGIGGGPFNVPVWIRILKMPPHIAAATAPCMLLVTTSLAVAIHSLLGNVLAMADVIVPLAVGVVGGAQAGAGLSGRLRSVTLTRILAALLTLISIQILYKGAATLLR